MKIEKWDDVHGNTTSDDRMVAFLESSTDSYAILQLKHIDETDEFRFMPYWHIQKLENQPTIDHYEVVYNGPIEQSAGAAEQLEALYTRFNIDHPETSVVTVCRSATSWRSRSPVKYPVITLMPSVSWSFRTL